MECPFWPFGMFLKESALNLRPDIRVLVDWAYQIKLLTALNLRPDITALVDWA